MIVTESTNINSIEFIQYLSLLDIEVWVDLPGFNNYQASNLGRIYSKPRDYLSGRPPHVKTTTGSIRKTSIGAKGYPQLNLSIAGVGAITKQLHSLVAQAFFGPMPDGLIVCHNDGNRTNNCLYNLRYDTSKSNTADRFRHGSRRLTNESLFNLWNDYDDGESIELLSLKYELSESSIYQLLKGDVPTYARNN